MRFNEELQQKKFTKFSHSFGSNENFQDESFGGIIHNGKYGWLARGPQFEVYSMKNGQKISYFRFDNNLGFEHAIITSITEIESLNFNDCILAITIQFGDSVGGCVSIYSVQGSKILRCIELPDKITSCHFINNSILRKTLLQMMGGCLAIGTDNGKIILLDLNLTKCKNVLYSADSIEDHILLIPCHLVESTLDFSHITQHFKQSNKENINFGIVLEVIEKAGIILSLLSILPSSVLVAGLEDGRMIIYDLSELQVLHIAYPPKQLSPLVKLSFLEPPDDPRACIYIWAFHENPHISGAVMHCLVYEKKYLDGETVCYENFQSCDVRLTLPIHDMKTIPITCLTITKIPTHGNNETISLCLLSCKSIDHHTHIFIFDLNQWYKEEMPAIGDWRNNLSYLAVFTLKHCQPFDTYIDLNTIALFNSIQRSEEHFYPIALSFDLTVLLAEGTGLLHWPGLQNKTLDLLNSIGSTVLLEPSQYFNEIIHSNLMPQFCDYNIKSTFSINMQREIILSVALEYNCFGILKECARLWADGSHLGRHPMDGLSLSTLTEWIWERAGQIKKRSNLLSVSLFDHSGIILDQRSQKELFHLTRQLKLLSELFDIILKNSSNYIPVDIIEILSSQQSSIKMAYEYQEVLLWFLNVGLLPEPSPYLVEGYTNGVKYPYTALKKFYEQRRTKFYKLNNSTLSTRTKSCRILYIDSFIEHECNPNILREHWIEGGSSNGLYPPPSLQAMLRTILLPEVSLQNKYILFIYLFLDLHVCAMENEKSAEIVHNLIKFPAAFKLNASVIKTVQAFWNLDHEQFDYALDEIISPFSQDKKLKQWQQELLIESLLIQHQPHLALRALQARTSPINSLLELKTLMTNNLIAEAFHLARLKNDDDLMKTFLNGCIYLGKWEVLRDLALTEKESNLVSELLKSSKSEKAGNLHFMLLLEKEKYIEALQFLDEMSAKKIVGDIETSKLILQAYNITMTPASKSLSEIYYKNRESLELSAKSIKNEQVNKSEYYNSRLIGLPSVPLSCQFLNQKPYDSIGGIYEVSALSINCATNYWENDHSSLLKPQNVPFIRNPQLELCNEGLKDLISYPEQYKTAQKRIREESFEDLTQQCGFDVNPLKKRKIIKESLGKNKLLKPINASLLTKFKPKINFGFDLDKETKKSSIRLKCAQTLENEEQMVLNTPLIKSSVQASKYSNLYKIKNESNLTPHSILKGKTHQEFVLHKDYNEKPSVNNEIQEEKSIHFDLPSESSVNSASNSDSEPQEEQVSINYNSTVQKNHCSQQGITCRYDCPQRRRSIHSLNSSIVSGASLEEFFSPVSSQNTTQNNLQIEEPEVIQKTPIRKEISKDSGAYANMSSGGSTRSRTTISSSQSPLYKPISRRVISKSTTPEPYVNESKLDLTPSQITTKSRRSRSKTPEIMMSPTRRSSRILALKSSPKPDDNLHTPIARPISLTRQVLESNALKVVENRKNFSNFDNNGTELDICKTPKILDKTDGEQNLLVNVTMHEEDDNFKDLQSSSKISSCTLNISESTIQKGKICMPSSEITPEKSIFHHISTIDNSFLKNQYLINSSDGTSGSTSKFNSNTVAERLLEGNNDEHIVENSLEDTRFPTSKILENAPNSNTENIIQEVSLIKSDEITENKLISPDVLLVDNYYLKNQCSINFLDETIGSTSNLNSNVLTNRLGEDNNDEPEIIAELAMEDVQLQISSDKIKHHENDDIGYSKKEVYVDIEVEHVYKNQAVDEKSFSSESDCDSDIYNEQEQEGSDDSQDYVINISSSSSSSDKSESVNNNKISDLLYGDIDSLNSSTIDSAGHSENSNNLDLFNSAIRSNQETDEYTPLVENNVKNQHTTHKKESVNINIEQSALDCTGYEKLLDNKNLAKATTKTDENILKVSPNVEAPVRQHCEVIIITENIDETNELYKTTLQEEKKSIETLDKQKKKKKYLNDSQEILLLNLEENTDSTYTRNLRSRGIRAQSVGLDESIGRNSSFTDSPNTRRKLRAKSVPKNETILKHTPIKAKIALTRIEESLESLDTANTRKRINSSDSEELTLSNMTSRSIASNENSPVNVRQRKNSQDEPIPKGLKSTPKKEALHENVLNKNVGKRVLKKQKNIVANESKVSSAASTVSSKEAATKPKSSSKLRRKVVSESSVTGEEVIKEEVFTEKVNDSVKHDDNKNDPLNKKNLKRQMSADTSKDLDEEPNLTSRRLTRTQQKMLEKSAIPNSDKNLPVQSKKAQAKSSVAEEDQNKSESETESVASVKNKVGRKRATKSEDRAQSSSKLDSDTDLNMSKTTTQRAPKRRTSKSLDDQSSLIDDDALSVSSVKSKDSNLSATRKSTRLNKIPKSDKIDDEGDNLNIADTSTSRRKSIKTKTNLKRDEHLKVINEEDEYGDNYSADLEDDIPEVEDGDNPSAASSQNKAKAIKGKKKKLTKKAK